MGAGKRFAFNKKRLDVLPVPEAGRDEYRDATVPGLSLRVTPGGVRSFSLYRRIQGRPARITIGRFPDLSIEQARRAARELLGEVARGLDPTVTRRALRKEPTVGDLAEHWMKHAKQRKRTWAEDERKIKAFLKPWGRRRLSSIKKSDVASLHATIGRNNGLYMANRLLALVKAMFNQADGVGYTGRNPAAGIKKFPEEKRDRFLQADELQGFFAALAEEANTTARDFFFISLLTGARKGNVLAMRWRDIDFEHALWRIPRTKSGLPVVVPLTGPALAVLETRRQVAGSAEWVFPARGKAGHLSEPKSAWKRIIQRAGLVDVRPHDLRRSLGSYMAMGGAGLPIVGKMLGHTQPNTTAIYSRLSVDSVREHAEKATDAMLTAGGVKLLSEDKGDSGGT